ncbi:hypothetical protein AB0H63_10650 [Micromonospora echinospora]|uniref:hypothetical protein n=1 Tax=Micromonospora echinospora TaxID=1877 RepID=UPI0033D8D107
MNELRTADDFWAAAKQLGEVIAARRAADRQAKRDARNARRRARYRAAPPKPKQPVAVVVADDELDESCRCWISAPCVWCTSQAGDDD